MTSTTQPLEAALENFVALTAKSQVAVVIPLYGYWADVKDNPVNGEVLSAVLRRVYSNIHHLVFIFVAEPKRIEHNPDDPESVGNILISRATAGNVMHVSVPEGASYGEYVNEGFLAARDETKAQFIIFVNPSVLLQDGAIDVLVDRVNYGDNAKVVSGFDIRRMTDPEHFDTFRATIPTEQYDVSLNFLGMPRFVADMLDLSGFKTHRFVERDIWQQMSAKGFNVITTQRIPIFPFDFPWSSFEREDDFMEDKARFSEIWRFDAGYTWEDSEFNYGEDQ